MRKVLFIYILLYCSTVLTQTVEQFFVHIKQSDFEGAAKQIDAISNVNLQRELTAYINIIHKNSSIARNTNAAGYTYGSDENILSLINDAIIEYLYNNNEIKAINILKEAFLIAQENQNIILAAESIKLTLEIYQRFGSVIEDYSYEYVLDTYKDYLYDEYEEKNFLLKEIKFKYHFHKNHDKSFIENFEETRKKLAASKNENKFLKARINIETSTILSNLNGELNTARSLLLEAIQILESLPQGIFERERLICARINLAIIYYKQKEYELSIETLNNTAIDDSNYLHILIKEYKLFWLHKSHEMLNHELLSAQYLNQYFELALLNDQSNKAQLVSEYETKYQTAQKEKQILKEQAQKRQLAQGLGGGIAAISIIALLVYRNTKRKQRIAEQEKELEIQRTEKVLKEKEIETINAMVVGQEKERQRLAGELHDNLGSTLATVRMQVENLERNLDLVEDPKALLSKTNALINQAYEKVRRISHERNAGVLAKDGLLPALERLARTVSTSNGLQVLVQDFGLDQRLSNDMEITIFRITQELITNVVKHAQASEATISLTQHENELNIMVEDNGKGFKAGKLVEKDGMGLGSIERRVEHLEGTMEVDSALGKGTNIIIDIPL